MSNNHFLIGLGGTGGRVIRAFRKTIFQEHRDPQILPRFKDSKTGEWSEPRARIGYLYVDTSATELEGNDDEWKVLGKSVKLDEESRLLLREASLETVFNNISSNSNIAPWLGDPEIVKEYLRGSGGTAGANQIRRLGRFLFASRASRFTSKLKAGFAKLVGGSKSWPGMRSQSDRFLSKLSGWFQGGFGWLG